MALKIYDTLEPQGNYPAVKSKDVQMPDGSKLSDLKIVPYIGANGNWWVGDTDTGVQAQGPQGEAGVQGEQGPQGETGAQGPAGSDGQDGEDGTDGLTPHIGENGNWWIGETDTGVAAGGSGSGLPEVTEADNGKILEVVNGAWVAVAFSGGNGGLSVTDDGNGNVTITSTGSTSITDDGRGNVTIA